MLSHSQIKYVRSLHLKKYREESGQFIAEGHKLVIEMVRSRFRVAGIYGTADWIMANFSTLRESAVPLFEVIPREMERISALANPGPVLAVVEIPEWQLKMENDLSSLILMLDDIRDPGNLGTIIRIADWFGIRTLICSENTVDLYNPKVVQATMGSITRVEVHYTQLPELLSGISTGTKVWGTFPEGDTIYTCDLGSRGIIVIGNESNGISPEVARFVTDRISIPASGHGENNALQPESLNASVATAIVCSEFMRRKTHG